MAARQFVGTRWAAVARAAWWVMAAVALACLLASLPGYAYLATETHFAGRVVQLPPVLVSALSVVGVFTSLAAALVCLALAALIFRRRADDPMALYVSFFLLAFGVIMAGPLERLDVILPGAAPFATRKLQPALVATPTVLLLALFPTGRFVPGWSRWLIPPSLLLAALVVWQPSELWTDTPAVFGWATGILWLAMWVLAVYAQFHRYRRVSGAAERQQTRWAIFGFILWLIWLTISSGPYLFVSNLPPGAPLPWWVPVASLGWWLSLLIIPICLTIAVLRFRLWAIDLVINRALVYGALTAAVVGLYLLVVGGLGLLFQAQDSLALSLLGVGLVAVAVQPARDRLQRAVNRLMYGERDDPGAVLARLGRRLEAALAPEALLATLVETVAQSLKLPYVAVAAGAGAEATIVAAHGQPAGEPEAFPLVFQAETIGQLLIGRRAHGEAFSPAERSLLANIAHQAGPAVHAARLTADLQHSRLRLVTAREEERRRLRSDLHDGLGPILAGQGLKLAAARQLLARDPAAVAALLDQMIRQNEDSVAEIRRLVYGLRPPALDERGLVEAVRDHVTGVSGKGALPAALQVEVESLPAGLPPLPAAVEVAAYRIALEALTNAARHAHARRCVIRFALEPPEESAFLQVEVTDDGGGLASGAAPGVGLRSMRERAEELGGALAIEAGAHGGTRVLATLPLTPES